jgi:GT2 family glycosyltransferase
VTPPSVVVVNWNGEAFLGRCLSSLQSQSLPPHNVVVVDNASDDGSRSLVADKFPQFTLLPLSSNVGFAAGANRGVEATDGELVALLNSDARAERTWLEALVQARRDNPAYSMFASRIFLEDSGGLLDAAGDGYAVAGFSFKQGWRRPARSDHQHEVFSPSGCAAMYTRDLWNRTGGFDESYFAFGEDVDLGFRARLLGHRCLYVPQATVHHLYRSSGRTVPSLVVRLASRNEIATLVKDMPWQLVWRHLPHVAVYQVVAVASHVARGCGWSFLRGRAAALRALPRLLAHRRQIQSSAVASWRQVSDVLERRWWRTFWGLSATWRALSDRESA